MYGLESSPKKEILEKNLISTSKATSKTYFENKKPEIQDGNISCEYISDIFYENGSYYHRYKCELLQ